MASQEPSLAVRSRRIWHASELRELAVKTFKDAKDDRIIGLGAEVAFFALLSLPPGLLAVLGLMGFVAEAAGPQGADRVQQEILAVAGAFLSQDTIQEFVAPTLGRILAEGRADVASFGILVAVYTASRATRVLMDATVIAYDLPDPRSILRRRVTAVAITIGGMIALAIVVPVFLGGPRLAGMLAGPLGLQDQFVTLWRWLYWPVVSVVGIAVLTSYYHLVPPWHTPWRRDLPGAVTAVVLWIAGAGALRLYTAWTVESNSTYGPLATPVVVLLWLYVTSLALLVGAEVNAEIEKLWPSETTAESRAADKPPPER